MNAQDRRCIICGCTDDNACLTIDGPCSWAHINQKGAALCSRCVPSFTTKNTDRRLHLVGKNSPDDDAPQLRPKMIQVYLDAPRLLFTISVFGLALKHPELPQHLGRQIKSMLDAYIDAAHIFDPAVWDPPISDQVWAEWRRWRLAEKLPLE